MDFLKKHYEKVLLGVVLLGLAVAVVFLLLKIPSEKQKLEDMRNQLIHPKVKPLTNLDLALPDEMLKRMAAPAMIDFSAPNKLFNPMLWQKAADGHLIRADTTNLGPNAVTITKLSPLSLKLTLDSVTVLDTGTRYVIGIEKEAAPNPRDRNKTQKYCSLNTKNETFTLRDVKAAPDDPTNVTVVLELNDTRQRVEVSNKHPFQRTDGYKVDLKYAPENKSWTDRRVGAVLSLNGEEYNIVAITENEVVLSARSNQKKWTVKYIASAAP
ncbi:MAG: hypothetical protein ACLQU3_27145 [Limisphaerales bacterium]